MKLENYTSHKYMRMLIYISSLIVLPVVVAEPQVLPKFAIFSLGILSFGALLILRGLILINHKLIWLISFIFIASAINLHNSEIGFFESLFGVYGRNNGIIMFISILMLVMIISNFTTANLIAILMRQLRHLNAFVLIYFFFQTLGFDFVAWQRISEPTSFIGNTNFLSTFLAISTLSFFDDSVFSTRTQRKPLKFIIIGSNVFALIFIGDFQGLILFVLGFLGIIIIRFSKEKSNSRLIETTRVLLKRPAVKVTSLAIVLLTSIGAFSFFLGSESMKIRVQYWSIGVRAFLDKPLFGYGLDSYLYVFNEFRDEYFISQYGSSLVSSSSHNVFIDYFVGGGVIIGGFYLILTFWISLAAIRILRTPSSKQNLELKSFSVFWFLFLLQNFVSIQYPTIAIWQWISGALILGNQVIKGKSDLVPSDKYFKTSRMLMAFMIASLLVLIPSTLFKNFRFSSDVRNGNGEALINLSLSSPQDTFISNYTAQALQEGGYWYWALLVARKSVVANPRNLEGWKIIRDSKLTSPQQKDEALHKVIELNPVYELP